MITITKAQMEHLGQLAEAKFIGQLAAAITAEYSYWLTDSTTAEKEAWVRRVMTYGQQYDITGKDALHTLATCIARYSLPVPLPPDLAVVLKPSGIPEEGRAEALCLLVSGGRNQFIILSL